MVHIFYWDIPSEKFSQYFIFLIDYIIYETIKIFSNIFPTTRFSDIYFIGIFLDVFFVGFSQWQTNLNIKNRTICGRYPNT